MNPYALALGLIAAAHTAGHTAAQDAEGVFFTPPLVEPLLGRLRAAYSPVETIPGAHSPGGYPAPLPDVDALLAAARDHSASYRALLAVLAAPSLAVREVLGLDVALAKLPGVPYAVTIERGGVTSVFTTSRTIYERENGRRPTWRYPELDAMARAHDAGRLRPRDFDGWVAAKQRGPWSLSPELAGVLPHAPEPVCSFGEVFDAAGAVVVSVEVEA